MPPLQDGDASVKRVLDNARQNGLG